MHISNVKVLAIPYSIIINVLFLAGVTVLSAKMVSDMMHKMNFAAHAKNSIPITAQQRNANPSLVELFTSEGCSSCPPADRLVAEAQKEFSDNTIVLGYHVDYWDRLGWKDPFSKNAFTNRQRQYAQHLNLESVYTPQVVVNGTFEFVGSDKPALWNAINSYKNKDSKTIQIETSLVNAQQLSVSYNYPQLQGDEKIEVELVQKNATIDVKSGENSGAALTHINIVQDLIERKESKGAVSFNLPANFTKENYMVVAFVQNVHSLVITAARKALII